LHVSTEVNAKVVVEDKAKVDTKTKAKVDINVEVLDRDIVEARHAHHTLSTKIYFYSLGSQPLSPFLLVVTATHSLHQLTWFNPC